MSILKTCADCKQAWSGWRSRRASAHCQAADCKEVVQRGKSLLKQGPFLGLVFSLRYITRAHYKFPPWLRFNRKLNFEQKVWLWKTQKINVSNKKNFIGFLGGRLSIWQKVEIFHWKFWGYFFSPIFIKTSHRKRNMSTCLYNHRVKWEIKNLILGCLCQSLHTNLPLYQMAALLWLSSPPEFTLLRPELKPIKANRKSPIDFNGLGARSPSILAICV